MSADFHLGPPPRTVDGLLAVPIDIQSVQAVFTFDGALQTAVADATMAYTVGPTAGNPFFDLRQPITEAWLDGVPFPPAQLAHHAFGTGPFTNLRVIESVQAAGSAHTLRVKYTLAIPDSNLGGAYPPVLEWTAGPRLRFTFGLSDLYRARYAEAWLPANLLFDQFAIALEFHVTGTAVTHAVVTNGTATPLGANHWSIQFPAHFTALSPMLEVRAADALAQQSGTVTLPVSGNTVTIEAWKPAGSAVVLADQVDEIKALLAGIESEYGPYHHGDRFVALFDGVGMEYEGGTTTSPGALSHETFHSWFARGIKPSSQADGWWDEGFTTFWDDGANDAEPFDFSDPPVLLCSRDPWQRHTAGNAYGDGSAFFRGVAALLGIGPLNGWMRELYEAHRGGPVSTAMMEEFLLSRSGDTRVVDAFHRFVYGLANPSPAPDLWLRDTPAHTGPDEWSGGAFWDSPDLWIRGADDGGTGHQEPEYGQDNWFHARVRNRGGACAHFVVTFHTRGFAGTEFVFPADFLPCTAAAAGFDLAPNQERIVRARWPKALVPPKGTHTCLLASVITRSDQPVAGRHVWEHNNLAQKNLTVVDLIAGEFMIVPVVIGNGLGGPWSGVELETWHPPAAAVEASLVHRSRDFFVKARTPVRELVQLVDSPVGEARDVVLDCGGHLPGRRADKRSILTSRHPELIARRFPGAWEAALDAGGRLRVAVPPRAQALAGFKVAVPRGARPGESFKVHLVQRDAATRQVVGGIAVQVNVRAG